MIKTSQDSVSSLPALNFILLGEDDIDDQQFLEEIFSDLDKSYKLICLNNGKKVIEYLKNAEEDKLPSLIILDYNLPELNGAEILKTLNKDQRMQNIPKIVWSTSNSMVFKALCMELGAVDYIVKPTSIESFVDIGNYMLSFCKKMK